MDVKKLLGKFYLTGIAVKEAKLVINQKEDHDPFFL
jgi:hypothetical protein